MSPSVAPRYLHYMHYAGFWRRAGATLIDSVIFSIVLGLMLGPRAVDPEAFSAEGAAQMLLGMIITLVLWIRFLGTPGKLLLGCQVVSAVNRQPLSPRQALIRYFAYLLSLLPLGLGFLWIAFDKRKQGFHDKLAGSVVLYNAGIEADDESRKSLQQLLGEVR